MQMICLHCQETMTLYTPSVRTFPELYVCTRCAIVAIPQATGQPYQLARLMALPSALSITKPTPHS